MAETVFLTGGTGYLGRRLIPRLTRAGHTVIALARTPGAAIPSVEWVQGALEAPDGYRAALARCSVVLHCAARTGKARAAEFEQSNVGGTRALLEAAKAAGVARVVHVSTIAVRYPALSGYPYGQSKLAAEQVVKDSGLAYTIVRPTIILGPGAGIWASLSKLAGAPFIPMFGPGTARVQPIHVDDVADALVDVVARAPDEREIDLGGPEVLTFEELLQKGRAQMKGSAGAVVHIPVGFTMACLRMVEPVLLSVLPVTSAQLYAFRYDSTAEDSRFLAARRSSMVGVDALLKSSIEGDARA